MYYPFSVPSSLLFISSFFSFLSPFPVLSAPVLRSLSIPASLACHMTLVQMGFLPHVLTHTGLLVLTALGSLNVLCLTYFAHAFLYLLLLANPYSCVLGYKLSCCNEAIWSTLVLIREHFLSHYIVQRQMVQGW